MEVAGVVLGAIPISLYALDNYKRCLQAAKDVIRYEATATTFRQHVFIQKKQLELTLRNTGLHLFDGQLPMKTQLGEHLSRMYSAGECAEFMGIIEEMEKTMTRLLEKLDLDSQGQPQWSKRAPERMSWEWRRVRRGLGSLTRNELVQQLQYWNTALSKAFEKPEIPRDEDGLLIQNYRSSSTAERATTSGPTYTTFTMLQVSPSINENNSRIIIPEKTSKGKREKIRLALPKQNPSKAVKSLVAAVSSSPVNRVPLNSEVLPLNNMSLPPPETSCICNLLSMGPRVDKARFRFSDQHTDTARDLILSYLPIPLFATPGQYKVLSELLGFTLEQRHQPPPQQQQQLASLIQQQRDVVSRKDRFAVAAATTWAVLYLCGTRWLDDDWAGLNTIVMGTKTREPEISCVLKPGPYQNTSARARQKQPATPSDRIRNRVLFTLGVLLAELCPNTTLEKLRSQSREQQLTDFELMDRLSDMIYLDAGKPYGYAVQRCLRYEFPGRDATKSLEFEQFRKVFFDTVAAPVQAVFLLKRN
ncbi:hypothetical protein OQA88_9941 [Cercophora sp. LCS_1]